jgi:hypothetical protein
MTFHSRTNDETQIQHDMPRDPLRELFYAAGIVDGEGCISISKTQYPGRKNPTYRLVLSIGQNHLGLLERVVQALDVPRRIYAVRRTVRMNRDAYQLVISDQDAYAVLRALGCHLSRKGPEAEMAVDVYERGRMNVHPGKAGHPPEIWKIRERGYRKLRRMK